MQAQLPRWSPDGKWIAFMVTTPGKPVKTYLASTEGGSAEALVTGEKTEWDPGWSSDGKPLVFGGFALAEESLSALTIHLFDLRTHQVSELPGSQGLYSPRWSPDGNYIAALKAGPETLCLYSIKTQQWEELAKVIVGYPSWSRDGSSIYFGNFTSQHDVAFFRVRSSDRKLE